MTSPMSTDNALVTPRSDQFNCSLPQQRSFLPISPKPKHVKMDDRKLELRGQQKLHQAFKRLSLDSVSTCSSKEESASTTDSSIAMEMLFRNSKELFRNVHLNQAEESKEADCSNRDYETEEPRLGETRLDAPRSIRLLRTSGSSNSTRRGSSSLRGGRSSYYSVSGDSRADDQTLPSLVSYRLSGSIGDDSFSASCDIGSIASSCSSSCYLADSDLDSYDYDEEESKEDYPEREERLRSHVAPTMDTPKVIDCCSRRVKQRRINQRRAARERRRAAKETSSTSNTETPMVPKEAVPVPTAEYPYPSTDLKAQASSPQCNNLRPILKRSAEQEQSFTVRVDNRSRILQANQQKSTSNRSSRSRRSTHSNRSTHNTAASRWDPM
ncbi:hypothetical protein IV203_011428 [Nitzschia inconspicua]|uniref:Uncharacterized protein n=1 Tax=Nitzschia inconspicua TaxID=303405 RepID=A0A9K3KSG8_9STRA|nr:hypothetical protein IV203_011428 [Nitzschia inconspicua]